MKQISLKPLGLILAMAIIMVSFTRQVEADKYCGWPLRVRLNEVCDNLDKRDAEGNAFQDEKGAKSVLKQQKRHYIGYLYPSPGLKEECCAEGCDWEEVAEACRSGNKK